MDEFSDDDFDNLNESVLQQLENNAIQSTQAQKLAQLQAQQAPQPQHNISEYGFDDDDFDDTVVIDELAQPPHRPLIEPALPIQQSRSGTGVATTQRWNQHLQPSRALYPLRPQYPAPPQRSVPQPLPSQRYPQPQPSQRYHPPPQSGRPQPPPQQSQFSRPPLPIPRPYSVQQSPLLHLAGPGQQNEIIAALQARLSELQSDVTAAKGEAAILRSKYDKTQVTHDAEVARLKKQNAEQISKQERIVEAARAAERTATTELQFARQDLREELARVKPKRWDGPATPKKNRTWGVADGFDGVEILPSPTKGQSLRRKDSRPASLPPSERTPTKGKRKRPTVNSPTFALETHSGDAVLGDGHATNAPSVPFLGEPGRVPFDFLKLVLDHSALRGQPPTFDLFSRFAFPSDPGHTFAAIIFQKLPQMGDPREPLRLLSDFAELVVDMWHRCLSERYHAPIYYLAALVLYTLELNAVDVAPHIISSLVPVCATTCRLVALPRCNSMDGNLSDHPDAVVRQLCLDIDVTQCLSLLYLAALGCLPPPCTELDVSDSPSSSPQSQFWRTMELDFVLVMLSPKHPQADWLGMMSLLWTSVASDSIGPIPSSATDMSSNRAGARIPAAVAATMIDCVSSFLCEPPRWASPGSANEIVARSAALKTLVIFAASPFGALQTAGSDVAIPRLVTVLCWAIDRLYDMDAALPPRNAYRGKMQGNGRQTEAEYGRHLDKQDSSLANDMDEDGVDRETRADGPGGPPVARSLGSVEGEPDSVPLLCRFIAQATRLLHFLVTDPRTADVANTATKLAASHGGSQRHLLTLARLTFAEEDLVFEAGIDAETTELAQELLELAVTPDEGEEVAAMFGD